MDTLTVKIPETLKEMLKNFAERSGMTKSQIVRAALIEYFNKDQLSKKDSFYDLAKDLAGSVKDAPSDLSSNKKYLNEYGK